MKSLLSAMAVCAITMSAATAQPPAPVAEHGPIVTEGRIVHSGPAIPLFTNVKVEDRRNIHPCAVTKIVMVPDPCACHTPCNCCGPKCVAIQICVPPCGCVDHTSRRDGYRQKYDYGKYEVEISVRNGYVKVDYDD